jgi:hypothetical protein
MRWSVPVHGVLVAVQLTLIFVDPLVVQKQASVTLGAESVIPFASVVAAF